LVENFKIAFGKEAAFHIYNMATCYTPTEYYQFSQEIETKYRNGTDMLEWIDELVPNIWHWSLSGKPRYGVTTTNTIEIVFNTLSKVHAYSYLALLIFIENYVLKKNTKLMNKQ
jgi:hypothetical protein